MERENTIIKNQNEPVGLGGDSGSESSAPGQPGSSVDRNAVSSKPGAERPPAFGLTDLLMLLTTMVWGANVSVIKVSFSALSPHAFNLARFLFSALIYAFIIWRSREGFAISRKDLPRVVFLALTGITLYQVFFITGLSRTSASLVSMGNAMTPIFIAVLSTAFGLERLRWTGWLGIVLSVIGFYGIVLGRPNGFNLKGAEVSGVFLILLAGLMWAFYTIFARPVLKKISPTKLAGLTNIIGTAFYLPFAWREFSRADFSRVTPGGWLGLVYSGSLALVFGFVVWYKSVERVGGARTGVYSNLTPVFGVLSAVIFLGDRISWLQVLSALVIFFGVYLTRNGHHLFKKKTQ
ncbi:MAG: Permease of the drug/metabolite transporter (DMT) superfamily [Candidatus Saccharicenans subterraneus]|uniref:Permease of the drug/metabolite transporter (DMT) superfamily n=1 Tax=Candidatus Saccharicenans subterraneus TaxID=2508984 RepID=A0A3E2BNG7_9BACT|nr:MAG: Permease of the drug/metabolite transporter (DMT) superfamily [Candidatus Saccharicenans subterraneum]